MNAEKYVNKIVKKVKCARKKRLEMKKQLLSDISLRMEKGEALEQIMDSMGTAEEIAEAFNQNLSETERKAYKRGNVFRVIAAIVVVLLLLAAYAWWLFPKTSEIGADDGFHQEMIEEKVENVILLLNQNDFDTLKTDSVEAMQAVLTQENIDKAREQVSEDVDWGAMQAVGKIYAQKVKQQGQLFVVTQVNVIYENADITYTISFDENMQLAGIYMK